MATIGPGTAADRTHWAVLVFAFALAGCASFPKATELRDTIAAYPDGPLPSGLDGRARFREILCSLTTSGGQRSSDASSCDDLLWRLADEPAASESPASLPKLASDLHVFVVSGAFGDCRNLDTIPFGDEIERLAAQGLKIRAVMVSGRSSAEHNARQLAEVIEAAQLADGDRIVLVGYSKGAVDSLQFLTDYPQLARRVAAVVSVAGPIHGSPLAETADWWYRELFAGSFSSRCDPGDGGVVDSLLPGKRRQWLIEHPLPAEVAYFSLAAFTTSEHLSHGLNLTWRILAGKDRRNDGQVLIGDAVIPGSILLGYVNADHWDVALSIERQMPHLSARSSPRQFPRGSLFDAMLLYVSETLASQGALAGIIRQ